jgi:hypothetical protein
MGAPFFLGYPDLGTAFRRALELVASVKKAEQEGFALSIMFACCSDTNQKKAVIVLSMHWKCLPRTKTNSAWAANVCQEGANPASPIMLPPSPRANMTPRDKFASFFENRQQAEGTSSNYSHHEYFALHKKNHTMPRPRTPPQLVSRPLQTEGHGKTGPEQIARLEEGPTTSGTFMGDIGTLITTMMNAQAAAQVALMTANNTNLIAFHTETAKAMMANATGEDSKLTPAKKKILMACAGHADPTTFVVPAVYKDIDVKGGTTDALGRILRHRLKPIPFSPYKTNIHVTPQLVATVKALSFLSNGDKTYAGCTKGMTLVATPWRTAEAMNEDITKDQYFNAATLKLVADIQKHITGAKVELPTLLLGVVQVLNNYL